MNLARRSAILLVVILSGCGNPFGSDRVITLPVSEVTVPAELAPTALLVVTVTVVTGGCKSFEKFVAIRADARLTLRAQGRDGSGSWDLCPTDIRYESRTYEATPPFADPFTVVVRQPDGAEITRVVRIR